MNITTIADTPGRLKLKLRPIYIPVYLIFGLLGLLGGIWVVKILAVNVSIQLADGNLTYTSAFLGKYETARNTARVEDIQEIAVEIPPDSNMYEIVVKTGSESFNMPLLSEGGDGKEIIANQLRAAIAIPDGTYQFDDSMVGQGGALGLLVIVAGVTCLAFLQTSTLDFNRNTGELTVQRRMWFLPFISSKRTIETRDITEVDLKDFTYGGRGAPITSYNVIIVTETSGDIPVAYGPMFRDYAAAILEGKILDMRPPRKSKKREPGR